MVLSMVLGVLPLVFIAGAVAVVAHLPALSAGYVLDDGALLVNNPYVRDFHGLVELLRSEFFAASGDGRNAPYYRPVSGALYWLSYQVLGTNALLQHALNITLHAAVVAQLVLVALQVSDSRRSWVAPAAVCLALATHPASAEIVAYVGGRQELLGWNLLLFGFWLVVRFQFTGVRLATIAFACCTLAALSREFFLAAPLLLLPAAAVDATNRRHRGLMILGGGLVGCMLVFALRRSLNVSGFSLDLITVSGVVKAAAAVALRMVRVVFWPSDVSVEVTPAQLHTWTACLILVSLLVTTAWTLVLAWGRGLLLVLVGFAWACLWSTIVLHVPVVIEFNVLSDRYSYAVLVGAAAALCALSHVSPLARQRVLGPTFGALVVLSLVPLCWSRSAEWRNEQSLQAAMYERRPHDPHSRLAEGMRLFAERQYEAAYDHCLAFRRAVKSSDRAGLCLGSILLMRGRPGEAAEHLEPYAFARPGSLRARVTLFRAWFVAGNLAAVERGLDYYTPLLTQTPDLQAARQELERRRML